MPVTPGKAAKNAAENEAAQAGLNPGDRELEGKGFGDIKTILNRVPGNQNRKFPERSEIIDWFRGGGDTVPQQPPRGPARMSAIPGYGGDQNVFPAGGQAAPVEQQQSASPVTDDITNQIMQLAGELEEAQPGGGLNEAVSSAKAKMDTVLGTGDVEAVQSTLTEVHKWLASILGPEYAQRFFDIYASGGR